jgi:hypothetical protein
MSESRRATVTVDLTPFGKGTVNCDATLFTGSLSQPMHIGILIGGLSANEMNRLTAGQIQVGTVFGSPIIHGTLEDGTSFEAELIFVKGVDFGFSDVQVNCLVGSYTESRTQQRHEKAYWRFQLSNLHIHRGDAFSHQPPPQNTVPPERLEEYRAIIRDWHRSYTDLGHAVVQSIEWYQGFPVRGGFRANRITFELGGRTWLLDDELYGQNNLSKVNQPLVSGTLSTCWATGDTEEAIERLATDITELLTFGLARDVKWVSVGCFSDEGDSDRIAFRNPGLLPFNEGGSATIDNWGQHNLKTFLETGHASLVADRDWWSTSIGLIIQARAAKCLEVKCSLLNTLLDRISSKVNGDNYGNEIDPELDARLDRKWFRWLLHLLLRTLSDNWERQRTDVLCDNVIKGWNAEPSFPEKVIRACDHLGIPPLSRTKLGFRHKLIHAGEMNKKLKTTDQKLDYLFGIESVVLMMMIQMLGFAGRVYLQSNPPNPKPVSEFLAAQEAGT